MGLEALEAAPEEEAGFFWSLLRLPECVGEDLEALLDPPDWWLSERLSERLSDEEDFCWLEEEPDCCLLSRLISDWRSQYR